MALDFDSLPNESGAPQAPAEDTSSTASFSPASQTTPLQQAPGSFDDLQDDTEKYSTPGQMLKAGVEGVAKGVLGPVAPFVEKNMLGVEPEDIRGREAANPILHGATEAVGLGAGMLTGTGEAAVMGKAGELAAGAVGLGQVAQDASLGYKVGSSAVKQAAEMAVLQSGDEAAKMIVQDPDASAQSAIANIGLSAMLGGAGGAFMTGAVSPLWDATVGPKLTDFLSGVKNHLNGEALALPIERSEALKTLGIEVSPATRAAMSGDPKAMNMFNELRESQHPEIMADIANLRKMSSDSVLNSLGVAPETVAEYSENAAGSKLYDTFEQEYKQKYEPIAQALNERNELASTIAIPDEARMSKYGQIIEKGMNTFGTDSPLYKEYQNWGNRLLAKETIGAVDQLKTEIGGELKKAYRAGDQNMTKALNEIKSSLSDLQESQISKQASELQAQGAEHGKAIGADILNQRAAANANYAQFAKLSNDLSGHLGVGEFRGFGSLTNKLEDKVTPEQLLKKFSPKNNQDLIPFLQQHFPETLEAVRQNEIAQIVKPAVLGAKGEESIDMNRLSKTIKTGLAGKSDYMKWAMSPEALNKIQAADTLQNSLPSFKSSGTAGWAMKLTKHMPMSAMAGIGLMMGHNPISAALIGEGMERMGVHMPNAMKLGMLKFMGSSEPVSAGGFKSMVDFLHNTVKGENMLSKATSAVFKAGAQVLPANMMPNEKDRAKLDKIVDKVQEDPSAMLKMAQGHTGHYLPNHQQALSQSSSSAVQYLSSIKPKPYQNGPLDRKIEPTDAAMDRYNRALDIAQQPAVVLHHIKQGTLQPTDVADIKTMYPALYQRFSQKLIQSASHASSDDMIIPYHTRVGASMFLGQPLDSSMTPASIIAAQSIMASQQPPQGPQAQQSKGRPSAMKDKGAKAYMTPSQAAESDRGKRD